MKRRDFLKLIPAVAAVPVMPSLLKAEPEPPKITLNRPEHWYVESTPGFSDPWVKDYYLYGGARGGGKAHYGRIKGTADIQAQINAVLESRK